MPGHALADLSLASRREVTAQVRTRLPQVHGAWRRLSTPAEAINPCVATAHPRERKRPLKTSGTEAPLFHETPLPTCAGADPRPPLEALPPEQTLGRDYVPPRLHTVAANL